MPKLGMPPLRRKEIIDAAILTIGERGTLVVRRTADGQQCFARSRRQPDARPGGRKSDARGVL